MSEHVAERGSRRTELRAPEPPGRLTVTATATRFTLCAPGDPGIDDNDGVWRILLPLGTGITELAIGHDALRRVRLRAGALTLAPPEARLRLVSIEPFELLLVCLAPDHVTTLIHRAAGGESVVLESVADWADPAAAVLAQEIRRAMLADGLSDGAYLQSLADALVTRITCKLLGDLDQPNEREALSPGKLARIVSHIDAHLDSTIRVDALAAMARLSRSHFSRAFQRMTGDAPQRFILKRRLCRARDLLASGDVSIAQIAIKTDFSSQAHLSTAFLRDVGATPARYRAAFRPKLAQ